jgi:hypothetical protein
MSDETRRVLDLLAQNKITVEEADQLLRAIAAPARADVPPKAAPDAARKARYIRIAVHKPRHGGETDKDVNIRVPIAIVRSGMRLGAILPGIIGDKVTARLRARGLDIDLSKLDPAMIETVLGELGDAGIDVDSGEAQVKITCE